MEKNTEKKFVVDDKYYFTYKKNNTEITFDNVSSINAETLCPSLKNDGFETDGSILFGTLNVRNLKTIQKVYLCGKLYDAKFEDEEFIKVYNDDKVKITPNTVLKCRLIIKDNPFDVGKNITIIKVYGDF